MTPAPPAVRLGTKAETLAALAPVLTTARILPLTYFSLREWHAGRDRLLDRLLASDWATGPVIVRSSAVVEDTTAGSQAGRFRSLAFRRGRGEIAAAVDEVFASYDARRPADQVLIQPQLAAVRVSGVACSCDASSGAPYHVVNWSESDQTDTVTRGCEPALRLSYGAAYLPSAAAPSPLVGAVWDLLTELVDLTGEPRLDIEFASTEAGDLVLLQARPLVVRAKPTPPGVHRATLADAARRIAAAPGPPVLGDRPVFGVMPDWNPAEMLGLRPRTLATSLYRFLITDSVWARARHRHGYRDLRGVPLLVDIAGLPYIDVAASLTSFVPKDVPDGLADRLVTRWLGALVAQPHLHDKLESRVVLAAHGFRTHERLAELTEFTTDERALLASRLLALTDRLVAGTLWERDLTRIDRLAAVRSRPRHAPGCAGDKRTGDCCGPALLARLRVCAAYGTLPFASLARAAFVATEFLDDLVAESVLSAADRTRFIGGLGLVAGELRRDFAVLDRDTFLKRYGHLRPGTYDILSPRYDEAPDQYFDWSVDDFGDAEPEVSPFEPTGAQLRRIERLIARTGFSFTARRLLAFLGAAIRGRERAKFEFTSVLSDVLVGIGRLGERAGVSLDDLSHVDLATIATLSGRPAADRRVLADAVARGRAAHSISQSVTLPPLVTGERDVWSFAVPQVRPNFVTRGRVVAPVADIAAGDPPEGAIAMIASADPGYDWLFARGIAGLVTAFGGANSHMAIRALEMDIPAVVGAGDALFRQWSASRTLDIDAGAGLVRVVL
jgi:phosphohistidine swiveling domain-containing protein